MFAPCFRLAAYLFNPPLVKQEALPVCSIMLLIAIRAVPSPAGLFHKQTSCASHCFLQEKLSHKKKKDKQASWNVGMEMQNDSSIHAKFWGKQLLPSTQFKKPVEFLLESI